MNTSDRCSCVNDELQCHVLARKGVADHIYTRKTRVINKFAIVDPESSLEASWICGGETSIHDVISASYDMMCVHVEMEGIIMSMTVEKEGRSLLISYMQHDNILPRT